ncbi:hypothetical protein [uncultured Desulfuromonas sp.]|uniref:hypothetical protein n=1 Tax=uncultured Desulfuromonas sp. TaxID=181013 RepID=UPI002AAC2B4A|nr:hypothetical protein [uncultured Desulfuromonas sp.]
MSNKYPGGHVEYAFEMSIDHRQSLSSQITDPRVKELVFDKSSPNDPYDYEWKLVIVLCEISSLEEADSIGAEIIDTIFNLLSLKLRTAVYNIRQTGHGVIPREGEGAQCHIIAPTPTCNVMIKSGGRKLSQTEIIDVSNLLSSRSISNTNALVNIFSYAMRIDEPVVKFMLLYLILYELYRDQRAIDNFIMMASPSTVQMPSPHNGRPETVFTKLRNELTHRVDNPPENTRIEIITNTPELVNIAHKAVMSKLI